MTPERYRDYDRARNGLQVESRGSVRKIATAVDCSLATVRLAAASGAVPLSSIPRVYPP